MASPCWPRLEPDCAEQGRPIAGLDSSVEGKAFRALAAEKGEGEGSGGRRERGVPGAGRKAVVAVDKRRSSTNIQGVTGRSSVWLERTVRDREAGGSNPL